MNDVEVIERMRAYARHRHGHGGTSKKVVPLYFSTCGQYFTQEYVESCITTLEERLQKIALLQGIDPCPLNPLEKLAIRLLMDTAGIEN